MPEDNVVPITKHKIQLEWRWYCNCGCSKFYIRAPQEVTAPPEVICSECGLTSEDFDHRQSTDGVPRTSAAAVRLQLGLALGIANPDAYETGELANMAANEIMKLRNATLAGGASLVSQTGASLRSEDQT